MSNTKSIGNILVIESGGSKSDWWYFDGKTNRIEHIRSKGYHPRWSAQNMSKTILPFILNEKKNWHPDFIYYYGTGIYFKNASKRLKALLGESFQTGNIKIEDDLIGAAKATYKEKAGIIAILGTGSNSGYYDGKKITYKVPSLGFLIGDEGSGAYLGKLILRAIVYDQSNINLRYKFEQWSGSHIEAYKSALYNANNSVHFLAQLSNFAALNREDNVIQQLIKTNFSQFIERILLNYEIDKAVNFVGGVAYAYQQELTEVLIDHNLEAGLILRDCGQQLINYHINELRK